MTAGRFGVVVPVKLLAQAKTRLQAYGDEGRADLALAFAADVVAAARACPAVAHVLVVTDDARAAGRLAGPGVQVVPDVPAAGLDAALAHGAEVLVRLDATVGVAALSSDLPALRADDLAAALSGADRRALVADASGTGTTLLAVPPGEPLAPSYGPGSGQRHRASGAVDLDAAPGLRRDVDTPADLSEALRLGVGPHTEAVTARLRVLQGTVRSYDRDAGGSVLLDDGAELAFAAAALSPDVRLLRAGQRVRLRVRDGQVEGLTLPTLPLPSTRPGENGA